MSDDALSRVWVGCWMVDLHGTLNSVICYIREPMEYIRLGVDNQIGKGLFN